jgi:alpha-tubulin suppressor-like RCC1 family protein
MPWSLRSARGRLRWCAWLAVIARPLVCLLLLTACPAGPPSSGGGTTPPGSGTGSGTGTGGTSIAEGPVVEVASGAGHTCARRSSGAVSCWGRNDFGQLGDGTTTNSLQPVRVLNVKDATAITVGDDHSCALLAAGQPICWGRNDLGQLGDGRGSPQSPRAPRPVSVRNLVDVTALASGSHHVCALRKAGSLVCWGDNRRRQVGNEGRPSWVAPVNVEGINGVEQLALGEGHTCARRTQGSRAVLGRRSPGPARRRRW